MKKTTPVMSLMLASLLFSMQVLPAIAPSKETFAVTEDINRKYRMTTDGDLSITVSNQKIAKHQVQTKHVLKYTGNFLAITETFKAEKQYSSVLGDLMATLSGVSLFGVRYEK